MDYSIKPIISWPSDLTEDYKRRKDSFSVSYSKTLQHLDKEIAHLGGDHLIIQLACTEKDIRMDGRLYATTKLAHPGVILTFNSELGVMNYHCDSYNHWHANLRAIGLTLQKLRNIDEHGVNKKGSQYEGYKMLPASGETGNGNRITTPEAAAKFISDVMEGEGVDQQTVLGSKAFFEFIYKRASARLHPDNDETGNDEDFVMLQDAAAVLREHHGM